MLFLRVVSWLALVAAIVVFLLTAGGIAVNYFLQRINLDGYLPSLTIGYGQVQVSRTAGGTRVDLSQLHIATQANHTPLFTAADVAVLDTQHATHIKLIASDVYVDALQHFATDPAQSAALFTWIAQHATSAGTPAKLATDPLAYLAAYATKFHTWFGKSTQPAADTDAESGIAHKAAVSSPSDKPIIVEAHRTRIHSTQLPLTLANTQVTVRYRNGQMQLHASDVSEPLTVSLYVVADASPQASVHLTVSHKEDALWQQHTAHANVFYTDRTLRFAAQGSAQQSHAVLQSGGTLGATTLAASALTADVAHWQLGGRWHMDQPQLFTITTALAADAVVLPGIAKTLATLAVYGRWQQDGTQWQFDSDHIAVVNADFAAYAAARTQGVGGIANSVSLALTQAVVAARTPQPLPLTVLSDYLHALPDVYGWYSRSVLDGTTDRLAFTFTNPQPHEQEPAVRASTPFADAALRLDDGWPAATRLAGTFHLHDDEIHIVGRGDYGVLPAATVNVRINQIGEGASTLFLFARSETTPLATILAAARSTPPLRAQVDETLAGVRIDDGMGALSLSLSMPLSTPSAAVVTAQLSVRSATARAPPAPRLTDVAADLRFSNAQFYGTARGLLNRQAATAFTATIVNTTLAATGAIPAADLFAALSITLPPTAHSEPMSGLVGYTLTQTPEQTQLHGDLRDVALPLPPPFAKLRGMPATLSLATSNTPDDLLAGGRHRHAALHTPAATVSLIAIGRTAAQIAVNAPATPPQHAGVAIHGNAAQVDLDGWLAFAGAIGGEADGDARAPFHLTLTLSDATFLNTRNASFIANLSPATVSQDNNAQVIRISATHLEGIVTLADNQLSGYLPRFGFADANAATTATVAVTTASATGITIATTNEAEGADEASTLAPPPPAAIPALSITIGALAYNNTTLGAAAVQTRTTPTAYQLQQFNIVQPQSTLALSGRYEDAFSYVSVQLHSNNASEILETFGISNFITSARVSLFGALSWPGAFHQLDRERLRGSIRLRAADVNYADLSFQTGVINFLSIFSPLSLLQLGFSDLANPDKLFFPNVSGDIMLEDGQAATESINMDSADVRVRLSGTSDFVRRTHDLRGSVQPGRKLVEAGSAVGIGTGLAALEPTSFVIGAVLGKIFEEPISQIGRYNYTITGAWDDPIYEEMPYTPPETEETPAAPVTETQEETNDDQ